MSGAQALLSMPVSQPPVSARDAGASMQDAAAPGLAFEDALGGVDQRNSPGSSGDEQTDETLEASAQDIGTAQQSAPPQMGGGLAAALAMIGMPWTGPVQASVTAEAGQEQSSLPVDPLLMLARALAANDSEPVMAEPATGDALVSDDYIDIRILGRERHLGIEESTTAPRALLTAQAGEMAGAGVEAGSLEGEALLVAARAAEDAAVEDAKTTQQKLAVAQDQPLSATQQAALAQSAASGTSKTAPDRTVADGQIKFDTAKSSDESETADQGKARVTDGLPTLIVDPKRQGGSSDFDASASLQSDWAPAERDVSADARDPSDFTGLMQKASGGAVPSMTGSAADAASPASQIADQLAAPASREVMTSVKTSGDTKVIELQLKPENLGSVTVRVSLKDDVISLRLEAQRADTAQEISREIDKLANSLKQAGYVVDGVSAQQMDARTISRIEAATGGSSSGSSTQGQTQSSGQGQSQGSGAGSQQSGNGRGGASAFEPWGGGNYDGQNNGLASERQTGLYV